MERYREREKAGEKKIKKKKKETEQRFCSGTTQIAPWPWPRTKIHIGLTMIGSVIWPNDPSARNKS